jgi:hypothetical protein
MAEALLVLGQAPTSFLGALGPRPALAHRRVGALVLGQGGKGFRSPVWSGVFGRHEHGASCGLCCCGRRHGVGSSSSHLLPQ